MSTRPGHYNDNGNDADGGISPILTSDPEFDSNDEQQPPTRSPTPTPPPAFSVPPLMVQSLTSTAPLDPFAHPNFIQGPSAHRTLHVPAALRRNDSTFTPFSEVPVPTLPVFLQNCNLSQYLQSFTEAGATDGDMTTMLQFDENELKDIMEAIPMKPFHATLFKKGIRELRERSRMGSMHFDNSQTSFMHPEQHGMLHYSHSQFFLQPSQPSQHTFPNSQGSHPSQTSHSSQSRRYSQQPYSSQSHQQPGYHRQSSTTAGSASQRPLSQGHSAAQLGLPTPSQVLSGNVPHSYATPSSRPAPPNSQTTPSRPEQSSGSKRVENKNEQRHGLKRRRSSSVTSPEATMGGSSPVLPEPGSFPSNSTLSWDSSAGQTSSEPSSSLPMDETTREFVMHNALIYGKHSSRALTDYEHAINRAAQKLALQDTSLLSNKSELWNKAKAELLNGAYNYKRGKSRSKLPEAVDRKDQKATKEKLILKREANASNAASARLRRIASLGEQMHRKSAEREALLANLLRLESPDYRKENEQTYAAEVAKERERLSQIELERQNISKELGSLKNKERKHQWYEKRKKHKTAEGDGPLCQEDSRQTDAEEEGGGTDTTADREQDANWRRIPTHAAKTPAGAARTPAAPAGPTSSSRESLSQKSESSASKAFTWKGPRPSGAGHIDPEAASTSVPASSASASASASSAAPAAQHPSASTTASTPAAPSSSRSKKHKDVFRSCEYPSTVKS